MSDFPIPWCNMCNDQLDGPGALVFAAPVTGQSEKWHVCCYCYDVKLRPLLAPVPGDKSRG